MTSLSTKSRESGFEQKPEAPFLDEVVGPMTIDLDDIHLLTESQRNAKDALRAHKKSGQPIVLTVNGKAER